MIGLFLTQGNEYLFEKIFMVDYSFGFGPLNREAALLNIQLYW